MKKSDQLLNTIQQCKDTINQVTESISAIIKDKENYSHEERWELFCELNKINPQHESFAYSGWAKIFYERTGEEYPIGYDSIIHAERYSEVDLVEAVLYYIPEHIIYDKDLRKNGALGLTVDSPEDDSVLELPLVVEFLTELKEALMQDNIHSCTYDW